MQLRITSASLHEEEPSKVYLTDVGTLCYLAGLKDPEHAAAGALVGRGVTAVPFASL